MKSRLIPWLGLGLALFGNACTSSSPSTDFFSREAAAARVGEGQQRGKVLAYLRSEGIMTRETKLESAEWKDDIHQWLVVLQHPTGQVSHWFVNEAADDYSGGVCQH
jgi:hypothetical protein